jgi:hypothetical protein
MKYIELFKNGFDSTIDQKIKPENWPYIGYSLNSGVACSMISEEPTSTYQMIDLGLPSGLKWADRNVGAENPYDAGLYFSWGNVDGHAVDENGNVTDGYSFDENTYSTTPGGQYISDELDPEHDAVAVNMGSEWRTPTWDETSELIDNTDHYYISEDDSIVTESELDGSKLHSICFVKKDEEFNYNDRSNFIEFPFASHCDGSLLNYKGVEGYIWLNSIVSGMVFVRFLYFNNSGYLSVSSGRKRYQGKPVRGVRT